MRFLRLLCVPLILTLGACGGESSSGGSGGSSGTTPVSPPIQTSTIQVDRSSVSFQFDEFGPPPLTQVVNITFDAPKVIIGYPTGVTPPNWLGASINQTSSTQANLVLNVINTNLQPGTYTTTLRAISTDTAETTVYDTVDIAMSVTVNAIIPIVADVNMFSVALAPIDEPVTRTLTLTGAGINWQYNSFHQFITLSQNSGTIPAGGQQIQITINPNPNATAGTQIKTLVFRNANSPLSEVSVDIEIETIDGVFTEPRELSFMASSGSTVVLTQTVEIDDFDITTAPLINWTTSSDQPWLTLTPVNGVIDTTSGVSPASLASVNVDPTGLATGDYQGVISFSNDVSAQVYKLPVSLVIGERKVIPSRMGVALSTQSSLQKTITITDTMGQDVPWQAVSNQAWLTVTPSGVSGAALVLTANTSGLANHSLSEATISVTSTLADITNTASINVGVWNSDAAPTNTTLALGLELDTRFNLMVTDPVRPYVYVMVGGNQFTSQSFDSTLKVYNVYTGQQVGNSIASQITDVTSELVISDDGNYLYAFPTTTNAAQQYERFDLSNLAAASLFSLPNGFAGWGTEFARVNSIPYIISANGGVLDPATGTALSDITSFKGNGISASQNGVACLNNYPDGFNAQIDCFSLFGTGVAGNDIAASQRNTSAIATSATDFLTAPSGTTVYTTTQQSSVFAGATDDSGLEFFSISGVHAIAASREGVIGIVGVENSGTVSLRTFNPDGTLIGTQPLMDGIQPVIRLSNDSERALVIQRQLSDGQTIELMFVDTP